MDDIAKNISSPSWWIGVVLVGILINVASAYLKPALDRSFSKISAWWRNQSTKRQEAYEKEIRALAQSVELQRQYEHEEVVRKLEALFGLGFALLLVLLKTIALVRPELSIARDLGLTVERSNIFFYALTALILVGSFRLLIASYRLSDTLAVARARTQSTPNAL